MANLINKLVPQGSLVFRRNAVNTHNSKLHGPQSNYSILSRELACRSLLKTSNSVSIRETAFCLRAREKLSLNEDIDVSLISLDLFGNKCWRIMTLRKLSAKFYLVQNFSLNKLIASLSLSLYLRLTALSSIGQLVWLPAMSPPDRTHLITWTPRVYLGERLRRDGR